MAGYILIVGTFILSAVAVSIIQTLRDSTVSVSTIKTKFIVNSLGLVVAIPGLVYLFSETKSFLFASIMLSDSIDPLAPLIFSLVFSSLLVVTEILLIRRLLKG